MFKRLTDNTGTGIGLALCKKIVENHHGHISVISEEGKGAEFTIILPLEVV
jgi:signal transduction histidine kinase